MDLVSVLKSEIVRPLITLVVPGTVALTPFIAQARRTLPEFRDYLDQHRTVGFIVATIAVIAAGLILESLGALWESRVIDPRMEKRYTDFYKDWYNYLRLSHEHEPVGQRYLRTVHLHLKFELAMWPALLTCAVGLNWLNSKAGIFDAGSISGVTILMLVFAIYFAYESFNSAVVLAKVRFALLTPTGTAMPRGL